MPPNCSGGGTGVFVNGRELHPMDVTALQRIIPVVPGRFWLDARGNGGPEGGAATFNLIALAQQAGAGSSQSGPWSHGSWTPGGNAWVGGDGEGFTHFMGPDGTSVYIDH